MRKIERIIITTKPIAFLIHQSKKITLPGFQGLPLFDVWKFFFSQTKRVGLNERAAAISFNLIMAIPAACIFIFTLVPNLPIVAKNFNTQLLELTKSITPNPDTYIFVRNFLDDFFNTSRTGLLSFGFLLVIFYSSNAMMGVIRAFDKSIEVQKKFFLHKRIRAIQITIILIVLVILAMLLLIGQENLSKLLHTLFSMKAKTKIPWWNTIRWTIIVLLIFYGISFIYKYAPSLNKRWKLISPGSLLATFLIVATSIIFSYWVNNFSNYNKVYGSIGTVLIIMTLIYFNSLILLIGYELNVSIMQLKIQSEKRIEKEMSGLEKTIETNTLV